IVREQLRIAAGSPLSITQDDVVVSGHSIECRINAESVGSGFIPSPGRVVRWLPPDGPGIRLDTHVFTGYDVPPHYDSLLAKLIVGGTDRNDAIRNLRAALAAFEVDGVDTTIALHQRIVDHPDFQDDNIHTKWLERVLLADPASMSSTTRRDAAGRG
ncbi:MAG: acetyl-CoA carboxylase biotin carboxylase subunit, partial [Ilumatobacteraceae bacterium]